MIQNKDKQLPIILVNNRFLFPGCETVMDFAEWSEEYRQIAFESISSSHSLQLENNIILAYYQGNMEDKSILPIGMLCKIRSFRFINKEIIRVNLAAVERVKILQAHFEQIYFVDYEKIEEISSKDPKPLLTKLEEMVKEASNNPQQHWGKLPASLMSKLSFSELDLATADTMCQYFRFPDEIRLALVQETDPYKRLSILHTAMQTALARGQIEDSIDQEVRRRVDQNQREYILREKLKVIKEQLGESVDKDGDIENLKKIVRENPYPQNIKEKAEDEIRRYEMMPSNSAEAITVRNYLDWLLKTPWYQEDTEAVDFKFVEDTLNKNHFGLEKPKERILEYLAVREFAKSTKAPIICLSGPPGIGKTSLAKSISEALKRKFVKISLGGVHDEAEIRGHRRTYIGSMPGRIIQAMKKAGVVNPVFLLDEIDKINADYKGDPASALLEVLDPEQNAFFSDHYIEESYNLSKVLFITTANYLENISPPLRDRLEIINLSSYTEIEKLNIAKEHVIPRQAEEVGLNANKIKFSEDAILHIIRYYTREAGVRQLERCIGSICRKTIVKQLKGTTSNTAQQLINVKKVKEYLGKEKFDYTKKEKNDQVGVVTGLAYTEFGGDILQLEVTQFEGKGKLILTGSLGDVMKESAEISIDYIKANAMKYKIDPSLFEKIDIHIHAPEGAVPKDGPSAGVTMTTALLSSLTNRPVRSEIAMTGEITLRGNVLPIGGLKEKLISAHRSGIKKVFIPVENEKDLEEIPVQVKDELEIVTVENISTIIDAALVENAKTCH